MHWSELAGYSIIMLAAVSVLAGWWLILSGIRGGAEALRNAHWAWWLTAFVGVALVVAGFVSMLLPPPPEYSPEAYFRENLNACVLGLPLVVILAHLWAEARRRPSANNALQPTREDARG